MGMSATARIVYGFDLGPDFRFQCPEDITEAAWETVDSGSWSGLEAILLTEAGLAPDAEGAAAEAVSKSCPFDIVSYGATLSDASRVLGLVSPQVTGYWEGAKSFDPASLTVDPEAVRQLTEFAARHGIEGKPGWLLLAEYG